MKESIRNFFLKMLACLPLPLALAPVYLIIGMNYLREAPSFLWYLPVLFGFLWAMIAYFIRSRMRGVFTLLGLIPLILTGIFVYLPHEIGALVPVACGAAVMLLLPPVFSDPLWQEWPSGYWIGGIIIGLIGQIVVYYDPFKALSLPLKLIFVLLILMYFLMMNYISLRIANHGREKAPAAMIRRNRLLTFLLFVPALLISCWGPIGEMLTRIWEKIKEGLAMLIALLMGTPDAPRGEGTTDGGMNLGELMDEGARTGDFWEFLEKALYIVAYIAAAGLLLFAVWFLGKRLIRVIRFLLRKMKAYQDSASDDYTDEAESTLDWDERADKLKNRVKNLFRRKPAKTPWDQLDGQGKIRRLYEQWAEKHHPASALTAREALLEHSGGDARGFADLYDAARYGDKKIAGEQAEEIRQKMRSMK